MLEDADELWHAGSRRSGTLKKEVMVWTRRLWHAGSRRSGTLSLSFNGSVIALWHAGSRRSGTLARICNMRRGYCCGMRVAVAQVHSVGRKPRVRNDLQKSFFRKGGVGQEVVLVLHGVFQRKPTWWRTAFR